MTAPIDDFRLRTLAAQTSAALEALPTVAEQEALLESLAEQTRQALAELEHNHE